MQDNAGVNILPAVDQLQGGHFEHPGGADPRLGVLRLQYTDQSGKWYAVSVPTLAALHLLNLLQEWSKDEGLDHLCQPPK